MREGATLDRQIIAFHILVEYGAVERNNRFTFPILVQHTHDTALLMLSNTVVRQMGLIHLSKEEALNVIHLHLGIRLLSNHTGISSYGGFEDQLSFTTLRINSI